MGKDSAVQSRLLNRLDKDQYIKILSEAKVGESWEAVARRVCKWQSFQTNFFVPNLNDVFGRDHRGLMDVAVFRLSKRSKRAGEIVRYELSDGYVEVKSGPDGMASIWDYDIVVMMISHLTAAMNRYRDGRADKPGRLFSPTVSEILRFCRRGKGARQVEEIEAALDRLKGTILKVVRERSSENGRGSLRTVQVESLIDSYKIISRTDTGKVSSVEIKSPDWIYREVAEALRPEVLTVHADYFSIASGIGRFIYRLARRSAGKSCWTWTFKTLYKRSGSGGSFFKFSQNLRQVIKKDDLPEYTLQEKTGKNGPVLIIKRQ